MLWRERKRKCTKIIDACEDQNFCPLNHSFLTLDFQGAILAFCSLFWVDQ